MSVLERGNLGRLITPSHIYYIFKFDSRLIEIRLLGCVILEIYRVV